LIAPFEFSVNKLQLYAYSSTGDNCQG